MSNGPKPTPQASRLSLHNPHSSVTRWIGRIRGQRQGYRTFRPGLIVILSQLRRNLRSARHFPIDTLNDHERLFSVLFSVWHSHSDGNRSNTLILLAD